MVTNHNSKSKLSHQSTTWSPINYQLVEIHKKLTQLILMAYTAGIRYKYLKIFRLLFWGLSAELLGAIFSNDFSKGLNLLHPWYIKYTWNKKTFHSGFFFFWWWSEAYFTSDIWIYRAHGVYSSQYNIYGPAYLSIVQSQYRYCMIQYNAIFHTALRWLKQNINQCQITNYTPYLALWGVFCDDSMRKLTAL